MYKTIISWDNTSERFIAFLDLMGFSNFVFRRSHEDVKQRMNLLSNILTSTEMKIDSLPNSNKIRTVIFSDSILLLSESLSFESLRNILFTSQMFITECFVNGIPIKGAISASLITADFKKSLFFGQGLIDAYRLQEELFLYGVIIDHHVEKNLTMELKDKYCLFNKTNTKSGLINHYSINWILWYNAMKEIEFNKNIRRDETKHAEELIQSFYSQMSGYPRKYVDNTLDYIKKAS